MKIPNDYLFLHLTNENGKCSCRMECYYVTGLPEYSSEIGFRLDRERSNCSGQKIFVDNTDADVFCQSVRLFYIYQNGI